jgi:hypothetical protein
MDHRPQLLANSLAASRKLSWLKIKLRGTKSNRDGLGAQIKVNAGGKSYYQQHDGKSGYLGQSAMPLYFGFGSVAGADSVEVTRPSGARQTIENPSANQLVIITESN